MKYEFSYIDLWPYVIIAFIFIICYNFKIRNSSKIIYSTLLMFSALRYDVGWDYTSYIEEMSEGYSSLMNGRLEFLSKYIFIIANYLNFYPFAFIFFAWLTLKLVEKSINKYSIDPLISWLVFYSLPLFFFASLSTIRQSLATAMILFSYQFLNKKQYLKFTLTILTASLFHSSALIGFLLFPLTLIPLNRSINLLILISSFFLSFFIKSLLSTGFLSQLDILSRFQDFYIDAETSSPTKLQYLYYIIVGFNLFYYDRLVALDISNKKMITITTFGVFLFNILSFEPITSTRLSAFFLLFWIYIIPYYLLIFSKGKGIVIQKIIFNMLLLLSFYYLFIYVEAYESRIQEKISFLPYKFWFLEQ